eukprot:scaffold108461_cov33-Tisochrysis_lutea.AAC.1
MEPRQLPAEEAQAQRSHIPRRSRRGGGGSGRRGGNERHSACLHPRRDGWRGWRAAPEGEGGPLPHRAGHLVRERGGPPLSDSAGFGAQRP